MGLFRSEDMSLYEISIPKDNAWEIMNSLGRLDAMHFLDLNMTEQPFNLTFANLVKRCDDTLRRISFIKDECVRLGVKITPPKSSKAFLENIAAIHRSRKKSASLYFEDIEGQLKEKEKFVAQQIDILRKMYEDLNKLIEYKTVLSKAASVIGGARLMNDDSISDGESNASKSIHQSFLDAQEITIGHIAGTVLKEEQDRFNKLIFRATRGNAFVCFRPFTNPITDYFGKKLMKSVFIVVFQEGEFLRDRIGKICDSFLGERFEIPRGGFTSRLQELELKIRDSKKILTNTKDETRKYLKMINKMESEESSALTVYEWYVIKERHVYSTLNKLKKGDKLFFGLYWIPNAKVQMVNESIYKMIQDRNIHAPQVTKRDNHGMNPPTYFYMNEFTAPFQDITDTYGVPMYKEVNAGLFNLVTFPFLFGTMFGDIAHGGMLFIFGLILVLFPDTFNNLGLGAMTRVRYLVFMLGMFSCFAGWCYNDFMSIPIELPHGSCYFETVTEFGRTVALKEDCVYPMGFDPKWYMGTNGLTYFNSMKMKLSVIFGVSQMSLGIIMKGLNYLHFCKPIDFLFEFIPQITLMLVLFGYMDFLIIIKWLTPWTGIEGGAPPIIGTMIGMFLKFGNIPDGTIPLLESAEYQKHMSNKLLLIGLVCVPTMLFVKPLWWLMTQGESGKTHSQSSSHLLDSDSDNEIEMASLSDKNSEKDAGIPSYKETKKETNKVHDDHDDDHPEDKGKKELGRIFDDS